MRFTPQSLLTSLHDIFGGFDLDPCGHRDSPVVAGTRFFGEPEDDGLIRDWHGVAYVNPPYTYAQPFTRKCYKEWAEGRCRLVVALLPVRTHTSAFHEVVAGVADVFLFRGRFRFDVYRFYNQDSGSHFYTADHSEAVQVALQCRAFNMKALLI